MNTLLATLTGYPVLGAITGALVTAVIQSSSVTTVLVVGFVSAGLMTLVQSVGVIFGANVGTTVTAQIVAFNTTALAFPLIAIGFAMTFISKQGVARHYGRLVKILQPIELPRNDTNLRLFKWAGLRLQSWSCGSRILGGA